MNKKIRVGVLFGGRSAEHEVSLQSAKNIISSIDKDKYEVVPIGIDKDGQWYLANKANYLLNADNPKLIALNKTGDKLTLGQAGKGQLISLSSRELITPVDVFFPILHGTYGEDGTVQGLLKLAGVPFVGASVLGSAIGMDKDVMKRLLRDADIPIGKFISVSITQRDEINFDSAVKELGLPLFVKPANLGSSVGVNKVKMESEFEQAINEAFKYDTKIIIEEFIDGRELECSVLGNERPIASVVGEILPQHEFYSYEAKYIDKNGAILEIPAKLSDEQLRQAQKLAVRSFKVLACEVLARVDFFLNEDEKFVMNEINTIPGFTNISMYPKLWEASGMLQSGLTDRLIKLALERHERESKLKTSYL